MNNRKKYQLLRSLPLFAFLFFLYSITCQAQFNDSTHHYVGFFANGSINRTNTASSYLANQAGKFSIKRQSVILNLSGSWVYGQQQNKMTNNDIIAGFNCDINSPVKDAYYWGLATYTSSYSLKIVNQLQMGAGIAMDVVNKNNFVLNLSNGLLYEQSDIYLKDTIRDRYHTFRNSARIMIRLAVNDVIRLSSTTFLQNSLSYRNDYIFKTSNGLDIKLLKWLLLNCTYTYNKFNRTGKENTLFTYGLKVEHYF